MPTDPSPRDLLANAATALGTILNVAARAHQDIANADRAERAAVEPEADGLREAALSAISTLEEAKHCGMWIPRISVAIDTLREGLLAESTAPDARDKLEADVVALLDRLAQQGGTIVCTGALTEPQITIARAAGRLAVDADGIGYVWVPGPKVSHDNPDARDTRIAELERDARRALATLRNLAKLLEHGHDEDREPECGHCVRENRALEAIACLDSVPAADAPATDSGDAPAMHYVDYRGEAGPNNSGVPATPARRDWPRTQPEPWGPMPGVESTGDSDPLAAYPIGSRWTWLDIPFTVHQHTTDSRGQPAVGSDDYLSSAGRGGLFTLDMLEDAKPVAPAGDPVTRAEVERIVAGAFERAAIGVDGYRDLPLLGGITANILRAAATAGGTGDGE